jgi:hypothetical protein
MTAVGAGMTAVGAGMDSSRGGNGQQSGREWTAVGAGMTAVGAGIYALIWPCRMSLIPRRLYLAASARVSLVLLCVPLYAYLAV